MPTYKNHATAPECQPPVCYLLPAFWHWFGSWLTPARGCQAAMLPNGAAEESRCGKFPEQDQQTTQLRGRYEFSTDASIRAGENRTVKAGVSPLVGRH